MPSPPSVTTSSSLRTPVSFTSARLAGSLPVTLPLVHSSLPSPITWTSTLPPLPTSSATPTAAVKRFAPPDRTMAKRLVECVPIPRA